MTNQELIKRLIAAGYASTTLGAGKHGILAGIERKRLYDPTGRRPVVVVKGKPDAQCGASAERMLANIENARKG